MTQVVSNALDQCEIWVDQSGKSHKVAGMVRRQRLSAANMLRRQALVLAVNYSALHPLPSLDECGLRRFQELHRDHLFRINNPEAWLSTTTLYKALNGEEA